MIIIKTSPPKELTSFPLEQSRRHDHVRDEQSVRDFEILSFELHRFPGSSQEISHALTRKSVLMLGLRSQIHVAQYKTVSDYLVRLRTFILKASCITSGCHG